jgi:integrase/recombinase XerD
MVTSTAVLVRYRDPDDLAERTAVAGFLAGYTGSTRVSYSTDLRLFAEWCAGNGVRLLGVKRAHVELFARHMEANGRIRSTVARRLSTLASFYRYCHVEGLLRRNPAANVRRPKVDHESRTLGLDRNELGALLVQAGLGTPRDHALIALLKRAYRSPKRSAPTSPTWTSSGDHRTLRIVRKGGKHVTIPLAPRTARALDPYVGERTLGPMFLTVDGHRLSRAAADHTVKRLARRAGITKRISPHSLRHSFITAALDAGSHCATSRKQPAMPTRAQPCATTAAVNPWTVTRPTSSPPSSPGPPAKPDHGSGDIHH